MGKWSERFYGALAVGVLSALAFDIAPVKAACPELEDLGAADPVFVQADRRNTSAIEEARQVQASIDALLRLAPGSDERQPAKPVSVPSTGAGEERPSEGMEQQAVQPGDPNANTPATATPGVSASDSRNGHTEVAAQ